MNDAVASGAGDQSSPFADHIVLVTGASRGLGFALSLAFASAGAQVIAVSRTVGGLEDLDDAITAKGGEKPVLAPLDLTDGDAVDRLGAALFERFGRLDMLAHLAAHAPPLAPVAYASPKDLDKSIAVNVTATARLLRSLDLLLRQAPRPTLLYALDERAGDKFWGAYGATKAAGAALVRSFAAETPSLQLELLAPPPMPTALRARTHPGEPREATTHPSTVAADILKSLADTRQKSA